MPISADLGPKIEGYVSTLVENGRFSSRSDVLREGVRLLEERENQLSALDAAIDRGLADVDAGRHSPANEVATRLATRYGSRSTVTKA
ncbi:type II toxin-antitoxin system ParD family antitoxin [Methylobacterium sp. W2]|uniref:type II toxin-antitoxin system ParD family antitoxin n=1 Tax=Methylobacterium sp. W2 TaxID=2598107 RepID=UPI001D0C60CE|nr:type II toxin-antitoxin system ParD family antitoxin [Methylobacterium sp. W2]MCC0806636.1 type II toxin-antitoxin system ParD family antitoxin [Methylobacterium sp. W2]